MPPDSSTDTDGQQEEPLTKELEGQLTAFRAAEAAAVAASKKRHKVWKDAEKHMVLDLWRFKKQSIHSTIKHLQRSEQYTGSALRTIDSRSLKRWIKAAVNIKPGEQMKPLGRVSNNEFETAVLAEVIIADHVVPQGGIPGTHDVAIVASDLHSYAMVQAAVLAVQKQEKWVEHQQVGKLKFSETWTHSFLQRF
eukprot:3939983-Rhodomonas_salina.1